MKNNFTTTYSFSRIRAITFVATLALIMGIFSMPHSAEAVKFYLDVPAQISRGEEVLATLKILTEGDVVNAVSAEILVPPQIEIQKVLDGNSALVLWIEKPTLSKDKRSLIFSGFTPGSLQGDRPIFSFVIKSNTSGTYALQIKNSEVLKNDGLGTQLKLSNSPLRITIGNKVSTSTFSVSDDTPPEIFTPLISVSTETFEKKPFISFLTQDKGVGIDYYEYSISFFGNPKEGSWSRIESPFLIPKEALSKRIFIKAVDKLGNERIAVVPGPSYYTNIGVWGIISALLILCVLFVIKRFWLRSR